MQDLENLSKALKLVEKYEDYLFRKAWGIALIDLGIIIPLIVLLNLKAVPIAEILGISTEAFSLVSTVLLWIIGIAIIIYSFFSASVIASKKRKFSFHKELPHIIAIIASWFFAFYLTRFVPDSLMIVSTLWAAACACFITYLILRKVSIHEGYPELLVVGTILSIASLPLAFISESALIEILAIVIFAISFVTGGFYSIINASAALNTPTN